MTHMASLVYGSNMGERAARAVMSGGRASASRSLAPALAVSAPVTPHADTTSRRWYAVASAPVGMRRVDNRGAFPTTVACTCNCHGTGDSTGRDCDVPSCRDGGCI